MKKTASTRRQPKKKTKIVRSLHKLQPSPLFKPYYLDEQSLAYQKHPYLRILIVALLISFFLFLWIMWLQYGWYYAQAFSA